MTTWRQRRSDTHSLTLFGQLITNSSEARDDWELSLVAVLTLRFEKSPLYGSSVQSRKSMLRFYCRLMGLPVSRFSVMTLSQFHENRANKGAPLEYLLLCTLTDGCTDRIGVCVLVDK